MFAITPNGVGKKVGARSIESGWPLLEGETFTVEECEKTDVLSEDAKSLRKGTEAELNPPDERTHAQRLEDVTNMSIDEIKEALKISN